MSAESDVLVIVAQHLARVFKPVTTAFQSVENFRWFCRRLGWSPTTLPPEIGTVAAGAEVAIAAVELLDDDASSQDVIDAFTGVVDLYNSLNSLTGSPSGVTDSEFIEEFAPSAAGLLLSDYLSREFPAANAALIASGVLRNETVPASLDRSTFIDHAVDVQRLKALLSSPADAIAFFYSWGADAFPELMLEALANVVASLGIPVVIDFADGLTSIAVRGTKVWRFTLLDGDVGGVPVELSLQASALRGTQVVMPGLLVEPVIPPEISGEIQLTPEYSIKVTAVGLSGKVAAAIRPDGIGIVSEGFADILDDISLELKATYQRSTPLVLLGDLGTTRLEIQGVEVSVDVSVADGVPSFMVGGALLSPRLVINVSDRDSFVASMLPQGDTVFEIPFGLTWTAGQGIAINGGRGVEVEFRPKLNVGGVTVELIRLRGYSDENLDGSFVATAVETDFSGDLGPVRFQVTRLGAELRLGLYAGNVGSMNLSGGIVGPTGAGLSLDASVVTGGGAILSDPATGRYAGAVQISIKDKLTLAALGILDTKLPGGQSGYSLLIIIRSEFPPIPLPYGFSLNGVGGLVGINRTLRVEPLQEGVRTGALEGILFPKDLPGTAQKVISDLGNIFPPAADRYVFGPMAKIGWGKPTFITGSLGLILEVPEPIRLALIGVVSIVLPEPKKEVAVLNIDVAGILDFEKKTLSVDASLRDSHLVQFPLAGDMAFRLNWADKPDFALAIGGFHPSFSPPPNFPSLKRISLTMGQGTAARIYIDCYLALTPNTLQFGASGELQAEVSGFSVKGNLNFDTIIVFSPFSLRSELVADITVSAAGVLIGVVHFDGTLTGATPWLIQGHASVSVLFTEVPIEISAQFGDPQSNELPIIDAWPLLEDALKDLRSWSASVPKSTTTGVALRPPDQGELLLDPAGELAFRQRVVPLNRKLYKFGEASIQGDKRFDVQSISVGSISLTGAQAKSAALQEQFAPGQFESLSDSEKLSRPSFEPMDAGFAFGIGSQAVDLGTAHSSDLTYETITIDVPPGTSSTEYKPSERHALKKGESLAKQKRPAATTGANKFASPNPPAATVEDEKYVVVTTGDLGTNSTFPGASTAGSAYISLNEQLAEHPEDAGVYNVVPSQEAQVIL